MFYHVNTKTLRVYAIVKRLVASIVTPLTRTIDDDIELGHSSEKLNRPRLILKSLGLAAKPFIRKINLWMLRFKFL